MTRHTISVLVENKFGVLARIAGLFSGRGYNIHSLNVAPSQDPRFSRMTIVVREKEDVLDQIIKHLEKLVNTVEVVDMPEVAMAAPEDLRDSHDRLLDLAGLEVAGKVDYGRIVGKADDRCGSVAKGGATSQ